MTNGIPLYAIEEDQTIEWAYQFSNAQDGRKIYIKPGVFDGSSTQMNDSEVESFDASKQTGTIKYTAKEVTCYSSNGQLEIQLSPQVVVQ